MTRRQLIAMFAAISAVVILTIGAGAWYVARRMERIATAATERKEESIDLGTVVTRVRDLNRLETASMHIVSESTIHQEYQLIPNTLAGDELTLHAEGDVIAGVDLSQLRQDDVRREPDGVVVVRMPSPQLLVSRIDNRTTHVVARKTGVFRRADSGMEGRARQFAEQNIHNEAVHRAILTLAQQNAEARIAGLLHTLGVQRVRFEAAQPATGG
jgi:hypothetical protein